MRTHHCKCLHSITVRLEWRHRRGVITDLLITSRHPFRFEALYFIKSVSGYFDARGHVVVIIRNEFRLFSTDFHSIVLRIFL